jgi:hypothetical protein
MGFKWWGSAKNVILKGIEGKGGPPTTRRAPFEAVGKQDDNRGGQLQIRDGVAGDRSMGHGTK